MSRPAALALPFAVAPVPATRLALALALAAAVTLLPLPSQAAVILIEEGDVIVQAHEVIEDDLIVYAGYLRMDGVVKGDLVVLGEEIVVEGIVEGDLIAAGKTIYLNGSVNDDARLFAYAVALGENARVADDFFDLSYSLEANAGSRIGGTLHTASRQALLSGQVVEDALVRAGALVLQGITGGNVRAVVGGLEGVDHSSFVLDLALEIPELPEGITLSADAAIGGDLDYRSLAPAQIAPGATIAGVTRHEAWQITSSGPIRLPSLDGRDESWWAGRGRDAVERLATLLILGLVLAIAAPRWLRETADHIRSQPMGMLGWGLGAVIFTAIASLLVGIAFTILFVLALATDFEGLALTSAVAGTLTQSALAALFLIALLYLAPVVASAAVGRAILERVRPSVGDPVEAPISAVWIVSIGAVLYALARAIPWVGPLLGIAASLVGLGVVACWLRARFTED